MSQPQLIRPAPLGRRLAAAVYDSLLIIALWFFVGFAALPFSGGEAIDAGDPRLRVALYGITALFFIGFWLRGGQTLGMRAWRLQLRQRDGGPVRPAAAVLRLMLAIPSWLLAGLGVLYMLIDPHRQTLHDRLSDTEVMLLPAPDAPARETQTG